MPEEKNVDRLLLLLAVTAGLVVANNYYSQPLLHEIGATFNAPNGRAALISTLTQTGYALGLFFLVPLGDMIERKKLILAMLALCTLSLIAFAASPTLHIATIIAFFVGFSSIVPQLLPPIAMQLASPARAGRAVGLIMGGLLLGISLSRFVGGVLGDYLGWRNVYWIATGLMIVIFVALARSLPRLPPHYRGSYTNLIASMGGLVRRQPQLVWLSGIAALQFAAFSLVWTTFAFHLASMPGHYPASVAGLFALIGAGGVIAALLAGHMTDRLHPKLVLFTAALMMLTAFGFFSLAQTSLLWLIPGVLCMDMGMQISHVTSMARILSLDPKARSRLNTVYMSTRFAGGASGTIIGSMAWFSGGWIGVCIAGAGLTALAAILIATLPLRSMNSTV